VNTITQTRFTFLQGTAVALLLGAALTACGMIVDEDRIKIAQIGEEAVTRGDLSDYIQLLPIEHRHQTQSKQAKLKVLEQMIVETLLLREAKKRGIEVSDDEVEQEMQRRGLGTMGPETLEDYGQEVEGYHQHEHNVEEEIDRELRLRKLQMQVIAPSLNVTDEQVRQFYEENKAKYAIADFVRIRFLTCSTMEEAQKIVDRVNAGESFEDIFKKNFAETEGEGGQEWPPNIYMPIGRMGPAELRDGLKEAQPGDIIGPVKREDGFDVVQLIDRQPPPLDGLKRDLIIGKSSEAYKQFIAKLKEDYQVQIFEDKLPQDRPY
jgi:foldase protein PrsA